MKIKCRQRRAIIRENRITPLNSGAKLMIFAPRVVGGPDALYHKTSVLVSSFIHA